MFITLHFNIFPLKQFTEFAAWASLTSAAIISSYLQTHTIKNLPKPNQFPTWCFFHPNLIFPFSQISNAIEQLRMRSHTCGECSSKYPVLNVSPNHVSLLNDDTFIVFITINQSGYVKIRLCDHPIYGPNSPNNLV